jgi:outer membrane immunogenic protein
MRRKFLLGTALLAFAAAGGGSAIAADIAARPGGPPPPVAAPAFISDWAGFYVGINGGGGWGHTDFQPGIFESIGGVSQFPSLVPPNLRSSGGIFGFQAGHNWQWGPVVGGLEIDFDGASIDETSTFFTPVTTFPAGTLTQQVKIDELASARARLGYLIFPNWLLFGTAGIGWGHERLTTTESSTVAALPTFLSTTSDANMFGWVVGGGLEWKFFNNWLLRGEYLHYDFGRQNNSDLFTTFSFTGVDISNSRTTVDVARAALSYKF